MTLTKHAYKTSVILDTREQEKTAEQLFEDVKSTLVTLGATILREKDHGRREFVRVTDRKLTAGHYFELRVEAPGSFADDVQRTFRLDKVVYRIIVQS
jgi:small subunit ribosomal protein S6